MKRPTAQLDVCSGLHAGARSELVRGQRLTLGSDEACDICLRDAGVVSQHLVLEPRARRLRLQALAPGVRLRNRELRQGGRATLRNGDEVQVATVALRYTRPDARAALALRWPWQPGWRMGRNRIAILLGTAALGCMAWGTWPRSDSPQREAMARSQEAAESRVRREIDARSGRAIYRGIVDDERTLDLLRASVRQQGETTALFQVAVRSRILQALNDVLARHYAVSHVSELRPGHYRVVTGGRACFLDEIAWDTTAVIREATEAVNGIQALEFSEDPRLLVSAARLPLSSPRWSLVSTPRGQWISDGTPRRYFEGGQLSDGQVIDMARCSVRLVDRPRKRIVHYSGEAGLGTCY
ncbi:MAG TPA: FHA domain-containing protein [Stenotrophomonas sp.]|nr:FHA domain-containing protein [Stenotrophomonas sp.]